MRLRDLRPDRIFTHVTAITPPVLEALGVRGLLLDIDGTLMSTRDTALSPAVIAWLDTLGDAGIRLFILSNSRRDARVKALGAQLGLPYAFRAGKPRRGGFLRAAEALGLPPGQVAMVGDQIFTDTCGANRAGVRAFLVRSLDDGRLWYQPFRRVFELPFMREKKRYD